MPEVTKETITTLSKLCRIHCTEEETEGLLQDLKQILNYIDELQTLQLESTNADEIIKFFDDAEMPHNIFREDEIGELLDRKAFLDNAPAQSGGMIRTPPVLPGTST